MIQIREAGPTLGESLQRAGGSLRKFLPTTREAAMSLQRLSRAQVSLREPAAESAAAAAISAPNAYARRSAGILVREALDIQQNLLRSAALAIVMAPTPWIRTKLWARFCRALSDDRLAMPEALYA